MQCLTEKKTKWKETKIIEQIDKKLCKNLFYFIYSLNQQTSFKNLTANQSTVHSITSS